MNVGQGYQQAVREYASPVVHLSRVGGRLEAEFGGDAALDSVCANHRLAPQPLTAAQLHLSTCRQDTSAEKGC